MAFCLALAMAFSCEKSSESILAEGRKHAAAKRWADAEIQFRKLIQKNANDSAAHLELAKVLYATGKGVESLREFDAAIKASPDNAEARKLYAEILLAAYLSDPKRSNEWRNAIVRLADLEISRDASSYEGWRLKGLMARADGNQEAALDAFRKALAGRRGDAEATRELAEVLALRKETSAEAEALLKGSVEAHPQSWLTYKSLADLYTRRGDFVKAEAILQTAQAKNPNVSAALVELAALYRKQNQNAKATQVLESLAKDSSRYPNGRMEAGDFLYAAKDIDGAIAYYRVGWQSQVPQKLLFGKRILRALSEQGKLDEARTLVAEILAAEPKDLEARTALALLDLDRENLAAATEKLQALVNENPSNHTLQFHLGRSYARAGETAKATAAWRQAIQLAPGATEPRLALARMLLEQAKAGEAFELANTALRLQPENPEAMHLRIMSLQALDRWDEAKTAIREFRAQYPNAAAIDLDEAFVLLRDGKHSAAESLFRKHYKLGTSDMRQIGGYAKALVAVGKKTEALQLLEAEAKRAPTNIPMQYVLAETYLVNGRKDQAISVLSALRSSRPEFLLSGMRLATLYLEEKKTHEAISLLQQLNGAAPGRPEILTLLAQAQEASQDWNSAKKTYREALQRNAQNVLAANGLANLIAEHGSDSELPEALRMALQAKAMAPRDGLVLDTLGLVYLRRNEKQLAISELQAALRQQPDNPKIKQHLTLALRN